MLHVSLRRGQVHARHWLLALSCAWLAIAAPEARSQDRGEPTLARAEATAATGRHLEAAAQYEQLARRGFMNWDAGTALLAAREYLRGGAVTDAERLLAKARPRARAEDERALLLETEAGVALARGDAARAAAMLRPLPSPVAPDAAAALLELRGEAEIASGQALAGVRTFEERAGLLATPAARSANNRRLFELLRRYPPGAVDAATGVSEQERGWLELPAIVATAADPDVPTPAIADWAARHPAHPGLELLPGAGKLPNAGTRPAPGAASGNMALLLPLTGRQQAAGLAVRDGFTAAWFASSSADTRPRVVLYDTAAQGVAAAYQRALAAGAGIVVGPLTKEDIVALVAAQPAGLPVPTLALNSGLPPGAAPPAFLYQFALDPEEEARAVARRIASDGLVRGVALFPDSAWGRRLHDAFVGELQATGTVTLTATQFYEPGARDFSGPLRAALGRYGGAGDRSANPAQPLPARNAAAEQATGPQFVFVAATPPVARAIRPQLRFQMTYDLPLYSTSDAWDPSVRTASDMDGLVFPEMPWLLLGGQGAPGLWDAVQSDWASRSRGRLRLYAFGYDAYRLAQQLASSGVAAGVDGLTGLLELNRADGRIERGLQFARVEGGRPQPAGASVPVIQDVPATYPQGSPDTP
jgi:outer membrane PBP1 activator LpoA protein